MKKPFDLLAEGIISKNHRGDWTPLELFLAGVRGWKPCLQQLIGRLADGKGPNDQSAATRPARRLDCNSGAMTVFTAARGDTPGTP